MPFLSETQAEEKLENGRKNACSSLITLRPLRDKGVVENYKFSDTERVLFGSLGILDGPRPAARELKIGRNTIEAAMEGKASYGAEVNPELKSKVDNAVQKFRDRISGLASQKVISALERIDDTKLDDVKKASELALIAGSLARITKDIEPVQQTGNRIQFNIFRPRIREEDEYEVIEVIE